MSRYLVTGVSGFIGASLAKLLLSKGHAVVGVDNCVSSCITIPDGVEFFSADCQEKNFTDILPKKSYDAIFHLAEQNKDTSALADPAYDVQLNVTSTVQLLQFSRNVSCSRFIYASSMDVYGSQPDVPVEETACALPNSFLGLGKITAEHCLRLYQQYGIQSTALRLFDVYGPQQSLYRAHQGQCIVDELLSMMFEQGHIHITSNPNRCHDLVYIADVVDAFLFCLDSPQSQGKAVNIGGSGRMSVGALIDRLRKLHVEPVTVEYSATSTTSSGICADPTRAKDILHYSPFVDIQTGLQQTYTWYVTHKK